MTTATLKDQVRIQDAMRRSLREYTIDEIASVGRLSRVEVIRFMDGGDELVPADVLARMTLTAVLMQNCQCHKCELLRQVWSNAAAMPSLMGTEDGFLLKVRRPGDEVNLILPFSVSCISIKPDHLAPARMQPDFAEAISEPEPEPIQGALLESEPDFEMPLYIAVASMAISIIALFLAVVL